VITRKTSLRRTEQRMLPSAEMLSSTRRRLLLYSSSRKFEKRMFTVTMMLVQKFEGFRTRVLVIDA